jgi:nicotinate-nucleotide--dimethylbenzimidazole phosphoribosyltransferase
MGWMEAVRTMGPLDQAAMEAARDRQLHLTKPEGSLGRLEDLSVLLAGMKADPKPNLERKAVVVMAGDHDVVEEGVSAFPQEVTQQMLLNFLRGGAAINVLARRAGARVLVVDLGVAGKVPPGVLSKKVGPGTRNIARGPAMTRKQAESCLEAGFETLEVLHEEGLDVVGTGDMGIGNTTPSSAVAAALTGAQPETVTGRGTGVYGEAYDRKVKVVRRALEVNRPDPGDPLDVLAKVGGFEIGGLAGLMLAAASRRIPVILDGFITGAAALIAAALQPRVKAFMIASHLSVEPGHSVVLKHLGLQPLLNLGLRLGEGTGAALAFPILDASLAVLRDMATFDEAGVSRRES